MEARLKNIVEAGPATPQQAKQTFGAQVKRACLSKVGIAVLTFLLIFVLLLALQPTYIFKMDPEGGRSRNKINYGLIAGLAILAAGLVVGLPLLIAKKTSS
jgi:hypothetical protein